MARLTVEWWKSDGRPTNTYGTAFFFTGRHLLTALHNVKCDNYTRGPIHISTPGDFVVESTSDTLVCTILDVSEEHDLAILDCGCDKYDFLHIAPANAKLPPNAVMDIFGYPGDMKQRLLLTDYYKTGLKDLDASKEEAETLLAPNTLTVTRGTIQPNHRYSRPEEIRYRITTCPGMSGGCILYNNMVYGTSFHALSHPARRSHWLS